MWGKCSQEGQGCTLPLVGLPSTLGTLSRLFLASNSLQIFPNAPQRCNMQWGPTINSPKQRHNGPYQLGLVSRGCTLPFSGSPSTKPYQLPYQCNMSCMYGPSHVNRFNGSSNPTKGVLRHAMEWNETSNPSVMWCMNMIQFGLTQHDLYVN